MLCRILLMRHSNLARRTVQPLTSAAGNRFQNTVSERPERWSAERYQFEIIEPKISSQQCITKDEWRAMRADFIDKVWRINTKNVDGYIVNVCRSRPNALANVLAYMEMMKESGIEFNLAISNNLLHAYYKKSTCEPLNAEEKEQIGSICTNIRTKYPEYMNTTTIEALMLGLSQTAEWRIGFEVFDRYKSNYQNLPMEPCCALIRSAFNADEPDMAFELFAKLINGTTEMVMCIVFDAYWEFCRRRRCPHEMRKNVVRMLEFTQDHRVALTRRTINGLQALLEEINVPLTHTEVQSSGICLNCRGSLQRVEVNDNEYMQLQQAFHAKVLIRNNVYMQSTPAEMSRYLEFIEKQGQFDWVIDGLNVAFRTQISQIAKPNPAEQAKTLATVLKHFALRRQRVLLFGRKHMTRWLPQYWNFIRANCRYFLVDNISKDDAFILYAALVGGARTRFISHDMMRNHAHLLGRDLKPVFQRWQQKHQYGIDCVRSDGSFEVHPSIQFNIFAHEHDGVWHVPFIDQYETKLPELYAYNMPPSWACFRL